MGHGIYFAVSGSTSQDRILEIVANNLSNVASTNFKSDEISFAEQLSNASGFNGKSGSFVKTQEVRINLSQGPVKRTGNDLDLALEGPGYLCMQGDKRAIFNRGGTLHINDQGWLVNPDGLPFLGTDNKPILLGRDAGEVIIEKNGEVRVDGGRVGNLKIVEFDQPLLLKRVGKTAYEATPAAGMKLASNTIVRQHSLEMSNVNVILGMTSMIVASRSYEAMQRAIATFKEIDSKANSISVSH